jgi:death-on-curing protein
MRSAEPSKSIPSPSSGSPTEIRYLTGQDIVELHRAVSVEFGGTHAHPGVVDSLYGLTNSVQRPQTTIFGKDAYPTFSEKAAAFLFALLQNSPFQSGNRRVALTCLLAFCELNERNVDSKILDEKTFENLIRRASGHRDQGIAPENVFSEMREILRRAIS